MRQSIVILIAFGLATAVVRAEAPCMDGFRMDSEPCTTCAPGAYLAAGGRCEWIQDSANALPQRAGEAPSASPFDNAVPYACPDGSWVDVGPCSQCPDGTYIGGGGVCQQAPDGSFVRQKNPSSQPLITPEGRWLSGDSGQMTVCPDGRWVAGSRCLLTPDGTFIGAE